MTEPRTPPTRRFQFTVRHLLGLMLVVALALGVGRWAYLLRPWLDPEEGVTLVESEQREDFLLVRYRMREPFKVVLVHELRQPTMVASEPGVQVPALRTLLSEVVGVFPSRTWSR